MNASSYVNSQTIAAGGTVQKVLSGGTGPGGDLPPINSLVIKARKGNTTPLYLGIGTTGGGNNGSGLSATTGYELTPGDYVSMDIVGPGLLYVFGATTGDRYDIIAVGP